MNPAADLDFWLMVRWSFKKSNAGMFCLTSFGFKFLWNNNSEFKEKCFDLVDSWRKEVWNLEPQDRRMGQISLIKTVDFEKMALPVSRTDYAIYLRLNFLDWIIEKLQ